MGSVVGKTGAPEPVYKTLYTASYEVRNYAPYFAAEIDMSDQNSAFRVLANYIGVFSTPKNAGTSEAPQAISMTAPVVMSQPQPVPISMTAPVVCTQEQKPTMQFILPDSFKDISQVPKPTDERVRIKHEPEKNVAVIRYAGYNSDEQEKVHLEELKALLLKDKLIGENEEVKWVYAGYNPPFTLGPFRRNEVWINLRKPTNEITKILGVEA